MTDNIKDRFDKTDLAIKDTQAAITEINKTITSMDAEMDDMAEDIQEAQAERDALSNRISGLQIALNNTNARVTTVEGYKALIDAQAQSITNLSSRLATAEAGITALTNALNSYLKKDSVVLGGKVYGNGTSEVGTPVEGQVYFMEK
jgi:chromosome segregation ATPase